MKRLYAICLWGFLLSLLAACGGDSPAPTAPPPTVTMQAEQTPEPTPTPPPTTRPRPTLPPSWTPVSQTAPTATLVPTNLQPTDAGAAPPPARIDGDSPACTNFGPDFAQLTPEFRLGESPTIAWAAVEGARLYRVVVFDAQEVTVHERLVEGTTYDIPAEVFTEIGRYGWTTEPLDEIGVQMCLARGEVLTAQRF
ncbi:hypothetical protein HC928_15620 [bacterium]|nr:hypothetical protein [bacterium]